MSSVRWRLAGGVVAISVLGGALLASGIGASAARSSGRATACTDPLVHDRYNGFHVGVPAGWYLSSISGRIVVFPDYSGRIEAVVQPAYVSGGQSPRTFLAKVLTALAANAKAGGNTLTFHLTSATAAAVSGRVGSSVLAGAATVSFLPVQSAHGSRLGVVSAYWAPADQLGGLRARLASVGACYGPERGTLARFYKDQAFGYTLPLGWTIGTENSDELFLDDGPNASANFILTGPFLGSSTGVTDAQSLLRYAFGKLGIKIDTVLSTVTFPSSTTVTGGKQEEIVTEFLGSLGTKKLHGLVRVISDTGGGVTSGALRIALATPALWNSLNGELIWITYSIQHSFTQDLAAIQRAQQQLAGFSHQVAGFDQALDNEDLVRDPVTGIQYEAPYSAYSQSGPQGAGYYIESGGSEHKLQLLKP
jgi:hypothetical protein